MEILPDVKKLSHHNSIKKLKYFGFILLAIAYDEHTRPEDKRGFTIRIA